MTPQQIISRDLKPTCRCGRLVIKFLGRHVCPKCGAPAVRIGDRILYVEDNDTIPGIVLGILPRKVRVHLDSLTGDRIADVYSSSLRLQES